MPSAQSLVLTGLVLRSTRLCGAILELLELAWVLLLGHDDLEASVGAIKVVIDSVDKLFCRINTPGCWIRHQTLHRRNLVNSLRPLVLVYTARHIQRLG